MTVEELIKELQNHPKEMIVAIKNYSGSSELWTPKSIKYVSRLNHDNKILLD